jgi:hypothetical protein
VLRPYLILLEDNMQENIIDNIPFENKGDRFFPDESEKYLKEIQDWKNFISGFLYTIGGIYLLATIIVSIYFRFEILLQSTSLMLFIASIIFSGIILLPAYFIRTSVKNLKKYFETNSFNDLSVALEKDIIYWKISAIYTIINAVFTLIALLISLNS